MDRRPRRIAMLSMHTSPLDQPGAGDAGGMNVYILETATRLARRGVEVEIFTRATSSEQPPVAESASGVTVRHIQAGPYEGLSKQDLPGQLCAFTSGVLRAEAQHEPGYYDLIHSHYWLSGLSGWLAKDRWGVPLVHSAHTLARVKNADGGDSLEPLSRIVGEQQVVAAADRVVANTSAEARQLLTLYDADVERVLEIAPGVDLEHFRPGTASTARTRLGVPPDRTRLLFVGRIQPLKAPDLMLWATALLGDNVEAVICGAPSGTGLADPDWLPRLAADLGISHRVTFLPPADRATLADLYRSADVLVMPSHSESFGLVALEAQACGTPVVAAAVGGLTTAVADGESGILVRGHDPAQYAAAIHRVISTPGLRDRLAAGAVRHAAGFSWDRTADQLLDTYTGVLDEHWSVLRDAVGL
ncbi:MAG: D-inositol-3-phosphate glycosyltransferase [Mycobacteriales bacterium]